MPRPPRITVFADGRFVSKLRDVYGFGDHRFDPQAFVASLRRLAEDGLELDDVELVVRWYEGRWPSAGYVDEPRARSTMELRRARERGWVDMLERDGIRVISRPRTPRPPRLAGAARDVVRARLYELGHDAKAELRTIDAVLAAHEAVDAGVGDEGLDAQMALDVYHQAVRRDMVAALLLGESAVLGPAAKLARGATGPRVPCYLVVPPGYERGRRPRGARALPGRLRRAAAGELLLGYSQFASWFSESGP